ncbi:MAG TPA: protein kinase [Polyangiaceae bacterium]|jgi:serine/threonine-protein kinase|nr:protein kinase [Polyangiaceae bacterium]
MLGAGAWVTPNVRLESPLGAGGMGSVWVAEHTTLKTRVVVKLMRPELAKDPETLQRFSREAAAAANVKSPHVVSVLDHGVAPDGSPFITMELLEGEDLGARLQRGPIAPDEAATIMTQTCKALARAHERGIVHRDVKPQNIFLCSGFGETFVKVLDFGIAKAGGDLQSGLDTTSTGSVMGTPFYMSPEQALGQKNIDFRTDVWACGVLGFEMLTGHKPFIGETVGALAVAICSRPLPIPSRVHPGVGTSIDAWFQRACAREAPARFSSVKELADAFAASLAAASLGPSSLGLARTVPSVPPQALPHQLSSTTNGPTSRGASNAPPPKSSPVAGIVAVAIALAFLGGGFAIFKMVPTASVAHRAPPVPPPATTATHAPEPTMIAPAASDEAVSIESLPHASATAVPPHAPAQTATHAPAQTRPPSTKPATSFDRNSID